jgi:hypothetical protein
MYVSINVGLRLLNVQGPSAIFPTALEAAIGLRRTNAALVNPELLSVEMN